jgi:hypothetical protein
MLLPFLVCNKHIRHASERFFYQAKATQGIA